MEIWKDVIGWEGKYFISNRGRLKSVNGKYKLRHPDGYITTGTIDSTGYQCVTMRRPGEIHQERVHGLVAKHFLVKPNSKKRLVVNHKDGNQLNNNVENLEWVTSKENTLHAIRIGLMDNKGTKHGMSKVTEAQVIEMRKLRKQGLFHKEIADRFGICRRQAGDIINGKNWGWLKEGL